MYISINNIKIDNHFYVRYKLFLLLILINLENKLKTTYRNIIIKLFYKLYQTGL